MSSLRKRLLVGVGIGVGGALAISGVLVYLLARHSLVAQFDDGLAARARALSAIVEIDDGELEVELEHQPVPQADEYFELVDNSNRVLAHAGKPTAAMRRTKMVFSPRGEDEVTDAIVTLTYGRATTELDATIARLRNIIIGVGLGSLVLVLALLAWIARVGLRPVDALAADIAAADLDKRIDEARPAELVVIARRLNELLARLDTAFTRERQLTAEVAHELRTPLAGLRATIEVALDRERAPERYRDALERSLAITKQTERMVESMLSLAKLDRGIVELDNQDVEIDALVREVLAHHAAQIADRELAVAMNIEAVTRRTDPIKLASVLHNLVDNAISYSEPRGSIIVDVEPRLIRITNTGCTLENAHHVFDRFWRGDAARTAGTHAGLGLAIAKTLVELLGGSITAEVRDRNFIATVHFQTDVDSARSDP